MKAADAVRTLLTEVTVRAEAEAKRTRSGEFATAEYGEAIKALGTVTRYLQTQDSFEPAQEEKH